MKVNKTDNSQGMRDKVLRERYPAYNFLFEHKSTKLEDYKEAFTQIINSDLASTFLEFELPRMNDYTVRYPASSRSELPVCVFDDIALVLKIAMPGQLELTKGKLLASLPSDNYIGVAGHNPLGMTIYHEPAEKKPELFNQNLMLKIEGNIILQPGETFLLKKNHHIGTFHEVNNKPIVFYVLQSQDHQDILWTYDQDTLAPWYSLAAKQCVSRNELIAEYLGSTNHPSAYNALTLLTESPIHFLRWAGIRNLLRNDLEKGLPYLYKAYDDTHPHVQKAAQQTGASLVNQNQGAQHANC